MDLLSREAHDTPNTHEDIQTRLEHRERQLEAIRRVSDALFTHPSTEALVKETLRIALDMLGAEAGTICLHDSSDNTLVVSSSDDERNSTKIPVGDSIIGKVFQSGTPRLDSDVQKSPDYNPSVEGRNGYPVRDMLTAPIRRTDAAPVGVLQLLNAKNPPFTPRDLEVLDALCIQAAIGIEYFKRVEASQKAEVVAAVGDVAHDIKNMLSPITTGVQTLEPLLNRLFLDLEDLRSRYGDTEDVQSIASEIGELASKVRNDYGWILQNVMVAADQVQARTKEISDVVKGEIAAPYMESGNLNETCDLVVKTMQAIAQKQHIALVLEADEALPPTEFDHRQIYGAIYNLVNNAIPETPAGGQVSVRTFQPDADTVAVAVADTGRGIPDHIKLRLFTAEAISTKPGGTGLGTRIVMGVVRRHNGTITVDTEPGKGTTFTITLPRKHE